MEQDGGPPVRVAGAASAQCPHRVAKIPREPVRTQDRIKAFLDESCTGTPEQIKTGEPRARSVAEHTGRHG